LISGVSPADCHRRRDIDRTARVVRRHRSHQTRQDARYSRTAGRRCGAGLPRRPTTGLEPETSGGN
jgi:hypothetical protein